MGRGPEETLLPVTHTNGQQLYENMLNFTNYQGARNQNYNEIPPHTCQNGYHQQDKKSVGEVVEKKELTSTAGRNVNWYSHSGKHYGGSSKN